jgi:hypothetical protein
LFARIHHIEQPVTRAEHQTRPNDSGIRAMRTDRFFTQRLCPCVRKFVVRIRPNSTDMYELCIDGCSRPCDVLRSLLLDRFDWAGEPCSIPTKETTASASSNALARVSSLVTLTGMGDKRRSCGSVSFKFQIGVNLMRIPG